MSNAFSLSLAQFNVVFVANADYINLHNSISYLQHTAFQQCRMPFSGMLRLVALVRIDVSEERIVFIMRLTTMDEKRTTLPVTSNRNTPRRITHGVTFHKTAFFTVTAVKAANFIYN
jgi:hypothetical protein